MLKLVLDNMGVDLTKESKKPQSTWDDMTMTWDESQGTWDNPGYKTTKTSKNTAVTLSKTSK